MDLGLRCVNCDMPLNAKLMSDGKYVYVCPTCNCRVTSRWFNSQSNRKIFRRLPEIIQLDIDPGVKLDKILR